MVLLILSQSPNIVHLSPLVIKYILFFSFGIVIGLWTTIAIRKAKFFSCFVLKKHSKFILDCF